MSQRYEDFLELYLPIPIPEELPAYNVAELERMLELLGIPLPEETKEERKDSLIRAILFNYGRRMSAPSGHPLRYLHPDTVHQIVRKIEMPPEIATVPQLDQYLSTLPNMRQYIFDKLRLEAEEDDSDLDQLPNISIFLLGVFNLPSELISVGQVLLAASISEFAIGEPATKNHTINPIFNTAFETLRRLKTLLPLRLMSDSEIMDIWRTGVVPPNYQVWRERQIRLRNYLSIDPALLRYLMESLQENIVNGTLKLLDLVHAAPAPFERLLFQTRLWPLERVAALAGITIPARMVGEEYEWDVFIDHLLEQALASGWRIPAPGQQSVDGDNDFTFPLQGIHLLGLGDIVTASDAMLRSLGRDMNLPIDLAINRQELLEAVRAESGRAEFPYSQPNYIPMKILQRRFENEVAGLPAPPLSCNILTQLQACPRLLSVRPDLPWREVIHLLHFHNLDIITDIEDSDADFIGTHGYIRPKFENWDRRILFNKFNEYADSIVNIERLPDLSEDHHGLEKKIITLATRPIEEVAKAVGMRVPPNRPTEDYFMDNIEYYVDIYARWKADEPRTLQEAARGERYQEYLQQLTDFEIEDLLKVRINYRSRATLINNAFELLRGNQKFFLPLYKNCSNPETTLLNETSSIQVIAYGTLESYICYEPEELYASFTRIPLAGDLQLLHPEAPIPFSKGELSQLRALIEQELPELVDLTEVLDNSLPLIVENPEKILKAEFDNLSAQDKEILRGLLYALFETGMYMRRWRGVGQPFPYTELETECELNPEPATLEGLDKIQAGLDSLSKSGRILVLKLPLVRERNGKIQRRGAFQDLYEELRRGEYCIRMASIWFVTSGYYYLRTFFNETIPDFNVERLVDIT